MAKTPTMQARLRWRGDRPARPATTASRIGTGSVVWRSLPSSLPLDAGKGLQSGAKPWSGAYGFDVTARHNREGGVSST